MRFLVLGLVVILFDVSCATAKPAPKENTTAQSPQKVFRIPANAQEESVSLEGGAFATVITYQNEKPLFGRKEMYKQYSIRKTDGSSVDLEVKCEPGTKIITGGCRDESVHNRPSLASSYPTVEGLGNGKVQDYWSCTFDNVVPGNIVTVVAFCK